MEGEVWKEGEGRCVGGVGRYPVRPLPLILSHIRLFFFDSDFARLLHPTICNPSDNSSDESAYHQTALSETLLPSSPAPYNFFPDADSPAKATIRGREMEDPLRAPFNFARAHQSSFTSKSPKIKIKADTATANGKSKAKKAKEEEKEKKEEEKGEDMSKETMYSWLSLPQNAHRLHRFGCAMQAIGDATPEGAILSGPHILSSLCNIILIRNHFGNRLQLRRAPARRGHPRRRRRRR